VSLARRCRLKAPNLTAMSPSRLYPRAHAAVVCSSCGTRAQFEGGVQALMYNMYNQSQHVAAQRTTAPSAVVPITTALSSKVSPTGLRGLGANICQLPQARLSTEPRPGRVRSRNDMGCLIGMSAQRVQSPPPLWPRTGVRGMGYPGPMARPDTQLGPANQ